MKQPLTVSEIGPELMDALGISRETRVRAARMEFNPQEPVTVHVEIVLTFENAEKVSQAFELAARKGSRAG